MLKTKTLNKTVTTTLILLITLSMLSMAFNVPTAKANPSSSNPSTYIQLKGNSTATAEWTTEKAYVGTHSVKFTMPSSGGSWNDIGEVRVWYNKLLTTIDANTDINFTFYANTTNKGDPYCVLYLDTDSDNVPDRWLKDARLENQTTGAWVNTTPATNPSFNKWKTRPWDEATWTMGPENATQLSLLEWQAEYPSAMVLYVALQYGGPNHDSAALYVDDMFINGVTYPLEPCIYISPSSGPAGTTVTVHGSGFTAAESVQIYFETTLMKTVTADGEGDVSTTFDVPTGTSYGSYTVKGIGVTSGSMYTATFYVTKLTITPTEGNVGDTLSVEGWGFNASEYARVYFDSIVYAVAVVDGSGHFLTSFTIPAAINGTHTVKATKSSSAVVAGENTDWYASATFTLQPKIWLSPGSGPSGTASPKVYGTGFSASATNVTIFFDKDKDGVMDTNEIVDWGTASNHHNTTATGGFKNNTDTYFNFTVPASLANGAYTVWANDSAQVTANTTFHVGPASVTLVPTTGIVGATVKMTGAGFTPAATIEVKFDTVTLGTTDWMSGAKPTVGTGGAFSGTLWVPVVSSGAHTVNGSDGTVWGTVSFTVLTPTISLNTTSGPVGTPVRITGSNFANGTAPSPPGAYSIKVYIKNATWTGAAITPVGSVSVTKAGVISANITIPLTGSYPYPGSYTIIVNASDAGVATSKIYATSSFEVPASTITLSTSSGTTSEWVNVTGLNFKLSDTITLKIDSTVLTTSPTPITANATGGFTCKIQIPSGQSPGSYNITATGTGNAGNSNMAKAPFTVSGFETILLERIAELEAKLDHASHGLAALKTAIDTAKTTILTAISDAQSAIIADIESKLTSARLAKIDSIVWADITEIKTTLALISGKLGAYDSGDTVASLLYNIKNYVDDINWADIASIKTAVTHVSTRKFDFGTTTSLWEPGFVQVTPSTNYTASQGYGWTNTTGLYARDRGAPDDARKDFVFSSENRTFQVDLTNGDYTVIVTLGDQSYSHDNMTITVEGSSATVDNAAGTFVQRVFHVTVTDGSLTVTMKDTGGVDPNWVINTLIIEQSWK